MFPMTLSAFHFVFTICFYEALRYGGAFKTPSPDLPQLEKFKVGLAGFASIGFMNLSLKYNSVGFYQVRAALRDRSGLPPSSVTPRLYPRQPSPSPQAPAPVARRQPSKRTALPSESRAAVPPADRSRSWCSCR